ncbi:hypothetical protein HDU92_008148, partial [Lobulomyces angularis]
MAETIKIPLIPIKQTRVLFPGVVIRLQIVRSESHSLIQDLYSKFEEGLQKQSLIGVVPLKFNHEASEIVDSSSLFEYGVTGKIVNFVKNSIIETKKTNIAYLITLEGVSRFKIESIVKELPYFEANVKILPEILLDSSDNEVKDLTKRLKELSFELKNILKTSLPKRVLAQFTQTIETTDPLKLADMLASMIDLSVDEKLELLKSTDPKNRLQRTNSFLNRQIQILKISKNLQSTMDVKTGKKQREFFLRQQLELIKKELGEDGNGENEKSAEKGDPEINELKKKIFSEEKKVPENVLNGIASEIKRLERMHPTMAEYQVIRTYLEWIAELPWNKSSVDNSDINKAREQLEQDHFGMEKVKQRVLEYLSVQKLQNNNNKMKGPILCFIGPPGVGKTSLGKSIALSLGRKFHRISLGGVRDEAEIRGHRRTYVGAMPGLIIQGLKKTGVNNPVFLLDEIDKLNRDYRGDPASALLEVLDPEQNSTFADHYINNPVDLSKILFIATANESDTIPGPLLDRMEVVRLPGYTFQEKSFIAKKYLIPKQIILHGLKNAGVKFNDDAIFKIAVGYTREAGVRSLEREIAAICRSLAVQYADFSEKKILEFNNLVDLEKVEKILGPETYDDEVSERAVIPGVSTGLAWTANGAGGLLFIEATQMPGRGVLNLTGKLGDVIKESAQLGLTWVRSNAHLLGLEHIVFDKIDVHIHFPAGAIPKDGPSAGVTIVTALVSLFKNVPVIDFTAMTGEISLRGQILPVGGIKEKVLAAHRAGIKRIILPKKNSKDLNEIPEDVRSSIKFIFASYLSEVLKAALLDGNNIVELLEIQRNEWKNNFSSLDDKNFNQIGNVDNNNNSLLQMKSLNELDFLQYFVKNDKLNYSFAKG